MSISSINVHHVENIELEEKSFETSHWVDMTVTCKDGQEHCFAFFDTDKRTFFNASKGALNDDGYCI